MALRSDEITSIIKSAIDSFDAGTESRSVGTVRLAWCPPAPNVIVTGTLAGPRSTSPWPLTSSGTKIHPYAPLAVRLPPPPSATAPPSRP